ALRRPPRRRLPRRRRPSRARRPAAARPPREAAAQRGCTRSIASRPTGTPRCPSASALRSAPSSASPLPPAPGPSRGRPAPRPRKRGLVPAWLRILLAARLSGGDAVGHRPHPPARRAVSGRRSHAPRRLAAHRAWTAARRGEMLALSVEVRPVRPAPEPSSRDLVRVAVYRRTVEAPLARVWEN